MDKTLYARIYTETEERKLLSLAYLANGNIKSGQMTTAYYAQCMVLLSKKLGFPITTENLSHAKAKYL